MAEAKESLSELVGLGAVLRGACQQDWLMLSPHDHEHIGQDGTAEPWQTCVTDAPPFRVRWIWKYRGNGSSPTSNGCRTSRAHAASRKKTPVLVVGDGPLGDRLVAELQGHAAYTVIGQVHKQRVADGLELMDDVHEDCDPLDRLESIAMREGVQCIVVTMSEQRGDLPMDQLLACRFRGIRIDEGVGFYERLTQKIPLYGLKPSYLVFQGGFRWPSEAAKRTADVLLALVALVLAAPLLVLLPLLVKLSSPGPVLYRQERVGLDGRRFTILKFRSMRQDAEGTGCAMWAEEQDPRVTALGRFLRQYRLDELPQLFNVLRGEMSMVGPRPERPEFIERLAREIPFYPYRLKVKPGITGWAQIKFRYGATVEDAAEKLQYDLYYIKHMSLRMDGMIALKTIRTVLFQSGAR